MKKICIDAGHFAGYKEGAVKPYTEGDYMLIYAKLLRAALITKYDVEVIMTRENGNDVKLDARGRKAAGCDLFLSCHSDGWISPVYRASVYGPFDARNGSDVIGKKLADAIGKVMGIKGEYKTKKSTKGDWEYYGVLRAASDVCPLYFIVEHGFHSTEETCRWLLNENNLELLAQTEADVLAEALGLPLKVKGDVNGDGKLTAADYLLAKRIVLKTYKPTPEEVKRCDVDGDGKVTSRDYNLIKRMVLKND